jgi:hypothetical protein
MGTQNYHRWSALFSRHLLTDGALYVAETLQCFWLMDVIASVACEPKIDREYFQVWKVVVNEDKSALVTCEDGNENEIYRQEFGYTDLDVNEQVLWAIDQGGERIIMVRDEY